MATFTATFAKYSFRRRFRNCGDSYNLQRIKIDPRKGVFRMISFHTNQKNGIKIITISTCRKIFIFLNRFKKQIGKHAEELVAVLTIQSALKLTHGKAQPRIFFILY